MMTYNANLLKFATDLSDGKFPIQFKCESVDSSPSVKIEGRPIISLNISVPPRCLASA